MTPIGRLAMQLVPSVGDRIRDERGQAGFMMLVFFPLMMILGLLGMAIATMLAARASAQRAADAAALAGCFNLPNTAAAGQSVLDYGASTGGQSYNAGTTSNLDNGSGAQTATPTYAKTVFTNDTISVHVSRTQPLIGIAANGFTSKTIAADATCQQSDGTVSQCDASANSGCFPYMVTSTHPGCTPDVIGDIVLFRDNGFVGDTGVNNCGWNIGSNNQKGFLRLSAPLNLNSNSTKGGNACGQEPTPQLTAIAASSNPIIWLPLVTVGNGNGANITINVESFVALSLKFTYPATDTTYPAVAYPHPGGASQPADYSCPGPFFGQIVQAASNVPIGGTVTAGNCTPNQALSLGTCIQELNLIK